MNDSRRKVQRGGKSHRPPVARGAKRPAGDSRLRFVGRPCVRFVRDFQRVVIRVQRQNSGGKLVLARLRHEEAELRRGLHPNRVPGRKITPETGFLRRHDARFSRRQTNRSRLRIRVFPKRRNEPLQKPPADFLTVQRQNSFRLLRRFPLVDRLEIFQIRDDLRRKNQLRPGLGAGFQVVRDAPRHGISVR